MVSVLFLLFTKEADEVLQKEPTVVFFFNDHEKQNFPCLLNLGEGS